MDFTRGPLRAQFRRVAIPAVAAQLSQMVFDLVDGAWIGRLSEDAIAGQGAAVFLFWAAYTVTQVAGVGAGALVAQRMGRQDEQGAGQAALAGLGVALVCGLAVAAVLLGVHGSIFAGMGLQAGPAAEGSAFLRALGPGVPGIFLFQLGLAVVNAHGRTRLSFAVTGVALAANAVLDPLLIFGVGPFPRLGIAGAAVATGGCQTVAAIVLITMMVRRRWLRRGVSLRLAGRLARLGVPVTVNHMVFSLVYPVLVALLTDFGTAPLAGLNLCHRLEGVPFFTALGLSVAVSTLVGHNHGANKPARATAALGEALRAALPLFVVISVAFVAFPGVLLRLLTPRQEVIDAGVIYLRIIGPTEVFLALEVIILGAFGGMGRTLPNLTVAMPLTLARIPLAWLALRYGRNDPSAVWVAVAASTVLKGVALLGWYRVATGRWPLPERSGATPGASAAGRTH